MGHRAGWMRRVAVVHLASIAACVVSCGHAQPAGETACPSPLAWSRVAGSPSGFAISGSGPDDIWLLVNGQTFARPPPDEASNLMEGDGKTFHPVSQSTTGDAQSEVAPEAGALWVAGKNDVFIGGTALADGEGAVARWDGTQWTGYSLEDNRTVTYFWGSGADDVWGLGGAYVGHWDGNQWAHVDSVHWGPVAGGAPMDWWSTGQFCAGELGDSSAPCDADATLCTGFVHHQASGTYDAPVAPGCVTGAMNAAWASAPDDVWFVGDGAVHYDGAGWRVDSPPATSALLGIWGTSKDDVWAVGVGGTIVHFDGHTWSSFASPTSHDLAAVWASGPCDVWAIGDAVYHAHPG
jgi:hypothetical protein